MNRGRRNGKTSLNIIIKNFYKKYPRAKLLFIEQDLLKILCYQKECGNTPNLEIFLYDYSRGRNSGGFNWSNTNERHDYWQCRMENFRRL